MNEAMEKARLLGEAIVNSEEYQAMQLCEAELETDPGVAACQARIRQTKDALAAARLAKEPDEDAIAQLEAELEAHQGILRAMPAMESALDAREAFSRLMGRVNQVLEFTITGWLSAGG